MASPTPSLPSSQPPQPHDAHAAGSAGESQRVVIWRRTQSGLALVLLGTAIIVLVWTIGLAGNLLAAQPLFELDHVQVMVVHYVELETLTAQEVASTALGGLALLAWMVVLIGYGLCATIPDRSMSASAVLALVFSILGFLVWPLAYLGTTMFLAFCYRGGRVADDRRLHLRSMGVLIFLIAAVVLTATLIVPVVSERFAPTWRLDFDELAMTERAVLGLYLALWLTWAIGYLLTIHRARRVLGRTRVVISETSTQPQGGNE